MVVLALHPPPVSISAIDRGLLLVVSLAVVPSRGPRSDGGIAGECRATVRGGGGDDRAMAEEAHLYNIVLIVLIQFPCCLLPEWPYIVVARTQGRVEKHSKRKKTRSIVPPKGASPKLFLWRLSKDASKRECSR